MVPPEDVMVPTTPPRKFLTEDSFGLPFTMMPMTWSHAVTLVNVMEKSHNVMKCLKMLFKFARSLTFGALTSWARSRLHEGTIVCKFLKSLFARFGTPRAIISDRGIHFYNDQFAKVMLEYGVTYRLSTAYHPQISGQVEVSNHGLKHTLERTVGENRASWSDKLDDALWTFRIAFKIPIGCTPYKLVYGKAYENSLIYKEKTKRIHDSKIKNRIFNVGDRVLLFNSRLKIFSSKLKTRWTGPFTVTQVFPYGIIELSQRDRPNFKVNGHRLKHYLGRDIPPTVVPDLQTFPMDQ
ncbi:reverse transcriptase domain-containing protein [Tanacetum coccineum]